MEAYVARQPILDKDKNLFAYELLIRGGTENAFPDIDGDIATSQVLSNSFLNFDIDLISNGKLIFVNFTESLLIKGLPALFPKEKIVVEILEDVAPSQEVIDAIIDLSEQGYCIALDDFEYDPSFDALVDLCKIIKIDLRLTSLEESKQLMEQLSEKNIQFLAEKVETYDEFQQVKELGFDLFQGYFFSKPEIIGGGAIESSGANMLQLIKEVNKVDYDLPTVEHQINADVNIAYKLLRFINSATFARDQEISSIKHAIAYLGIDDTRRFISMIALSEISSNKPNKLVLSAIIRGRFCEKIGELTKIAIQSQELFILGLFSHIDAMYDSNMEILMKNLPLAAQIKEALISESGELYNILLLCKYYEEGDWKHCLKLTHKLNIDETELPKYYSSSLEWANGFASL